MHKVAEGAPEAAVQVVVAVLQLAVVVVRVEQPDRQARELRAEDLEPVPKVDSEHKAAAPVRKAELTVVPELAVHRASWREHARRPKRSYEHAKWTIR